MTDPMRDAHSRLAPFGANIKRIFLESFTAMDLADPLLSFEEQVPGAQVRQALEAHGRRVAGVRRGGVVTGYVVHDALEDTTPCGQAMQVIVPEMIVRPETPIQELVPSLLAEASPALFIEQLGQPIGLVAIGDLQKPAVRMWLFGIISVIEMILTRLIDASHPDESWQAHLSEGRLKAAQKLKRERAKAGQAAALLECLQLGDKALLVSRNGKLRELFGAPSRRQMAKNFREVEKLRNTLAHAQVIHADLWPAVLQMIEGIQSVMPAFQERVQAFMADLQS